MANDVVEQIRERIDIVELIGQQVNLRKAGRNFTGLCPFHQEKTPSFVVFPENQSFHCFGCGAGGDAFGFVMQHEHVDFRQALEQLAARTGVELRPAAPPPPPEEVERHERLARANSVAANWFAHVLWNTEAGEPGRQLLERRGVDRTTAERFKLGYAPESWDALQNVMIKRDFSPRDLVSAGLAIEREGGDGSYDRFRARLIFPIQDKEGHVIGFGGRALGDAMPKYLNTPQTPLFDKGANLYALHLAQDAIRREREVIVVEGYMDAIAAHQFGFENVVASMGTALTSAQVRLVRRSVDRILLALDSDTAGQMATLRGLDVLRDGLTEADRPVADTAGLVRFERTLKTDIRIVKLPSGKDPDELIRKDVDAWRSAVAAPVPLIDYYIDTVIGSTPPVDPREKSELTRRIAPVLREISDRIVQSHYVGEVARRLQIDERLVLSTNATTPNRHPRPIESARTRQPVANPEEYLFALILRHPLILAPTIAAIPEQELLDARDVEIVRVLQRTAPESTEEALEALDDATRERADQLLQQLGDRPLSYSAQVRREADGALQRLRKERHDERMRQLIDELSTAARDSDQETVRHYLELIDQLRERYPEFYPEPSPYFRDIRDNAS
ncbi:MAG TPA: DNA primase [Nitrolancea sp.]